MKVWRYNLRRRAPTWAAAAALGLALACDRAPEGAGRPADPPLPGSGETRAVPPPGPAGSDAGTPAPRETAPTLVQLASGDSAEVVGVGPAMVPNQPSGLLFTYHPFFAPNEDTVRTVRVATELWHSTVRPRLREPLPPFVVLQATSRRAGPIRGTFGETTFGVVVERRQDGEWYRLGTSEPL